MHLRRPVRGHFTACTFVAAIQLTVLVNVARLGFVSTRPPMIFETNPVKFCIQKVCTIDNLDTVQCRQETNSDM